MQNDRLRFASLGSGSRGNATLVEKDGTLVMVDCGFSATQVRRRMSRLQREPSQLTAIVVTHEHGDHVAGVAALAREYGIPVWLTSGTRAGLRDRALPATESIAPDRAFAIDGLEVHPVTVPHDAREPVQFVFTDGERRLGILTDLGSVTPHVERCMGRLDAFMLESNHDPGMLEAGPYPNRLKKRVGGRYGHLNNGQAAGLLAAVDTSRLQYLVAAHISEKNNTPGLACAALAGALGCGTEDVIVAHQDDGLGWHEIV